jgi:hypothetical protein
MDNPQKLATLGSQDEDKQNTTQLLTLDYAKIYIQCSKTVFLIIYSETSQMYKRL